MEKAKLRLKLGGITLVSFGSAREIKSWVTTKYTALNERYLCGGKLYAVCRAVRIQLSYLIVATEKIRYGDHNEERIDPSLF
jgi:hypothetical protein